MRKEYYTCFGSPEVIEKFPVEGDSITHLIYSFVYATRSGNLTDTIGVDPTDGSDTLMHDNTVASLNALAALKKRNPNLKIKLAIGGGGADTHPDKFQEYVIRSLFDKDDLLDRLVEALAKVCERFDLDGIDVDYEHPQTDADVVGVTKLCRKLTERLAKIKPDMELSIALAGVPAQIELYGNRLAEIDKYIGMWNIMNYDFDYVPFPILLYSAPLTRGKKPECAVYSGSEAVDAFIAKGFSPSKLNFGVPFYGRSFKPVAGTFDVFFGQTKYDSRDAFLYRDVTDDIAKGTNGYERVYDPDSQVTYAILRNPNTKEITDVRIYDDVETMEKKVKYAKEKGLAGIMIWEISQDSDSWELMNVINNNQW